MTAETRYRAGRRYPRNIYRGEDEHVAVAFDPAMGPLIAACLNGEQPIVEQVRAHYEQRIADLQAEMGKQLAAMEKHIARLTDQTGAPF